jgi:hypothetical protein
VRDPRQRLDIHVGLAIDPKQRSLIGLARNRQSSTLLRRLSIPHDGHDGPGQDHPDLREQT